MPKHLSSVAVMAAAIAAGCSHTPVPSEPLGASRSAIETARVSGADDASTPEMALARDKLAQADAAARANDTTKAVRLAEEAAIDAQVARAKVAAEKSRKAATEVDASLAALRDEMSRDAAVTTTPVRP